MAPEEVEKIAQGRVWSGQTAVKLGLVDKLGSLQDAVREAANKAGLRDYEATYIEKPLTARELFIQQLNRFLFSLIDDSALDDLHLPSRLLSYFGSELEQMMRLNDPRGMYAYCLTCNVQ
jgi:protease-4